MRISCVTPCFVAITTIVLVAAPLPAQRPQEPRRDGLGDNAALRYWQAFVHTPKLDDAQLKRLAAAPGGDDAGAAKLVESGKDALLYLRRGAAIGSCDWGLHAEDGPYLLLPHLARGRELARLAAAGAGREFAAGNGVEGIDRAADAIVLGRHLSTDLPTMVSYLVQLVVERTAVEALAPHLAGLDAAALERLERRLAALPPGGSMEACLRVERESFLEWAIGHLGRMNDNDPWRQKVLGPFGGNPGDADTDPAIVDKAVAASGGTRQGVLKQFEGLRQYFREVEQILSLPRHEFTARLAEIEKRANANPLATLTLPQLGQFYDRDAVGRTRMTLLNAALAVARGGPARAKAFKDANGEPIEYAAAPNGFELRSTVLDDGKPVVLKVGGRKVKAA